MIRKPMAKFIYEMITWERTGNTTETRDHCRDMINNDGRMSLLLDYDKSIGFYPTRERAEQAMQEAADYAIDCDRNLCFVFIRQRAFCTQMSPSDYLTEWSYANCILFDESLVKNDALDTSAFFGRPAEKIHHDVGDIVIVVDERSIYWGIVYATPPTPDKVADINKRALLHGMLTDASQSVLDDSDDSYIILTNDGNYGLSHEHVLSQHVFCPDRAVPGIVRELLELGLQKAKAK